VIDAEKYEKIHINLTHNIRCHRGLWVHGETIKCAIYAVFLCALCLCPRLRKSRVCSRCQMMWTITGAP